MNKRDSTDEKVRGILDDLDRQANYVAAGFIIFWIMYVLVWIGVLVYFSW